MTISSRLTTLMNKGKYKFEPAKLEPDNLQNHLNLTYYYRNHQLQFAGIRSTGFKDFLLKPELMKAVVDCGFEHPSEVQQECIP